MPPEARPSFGAEASAATKVEVSAPDLLRKAVAEAEERAELLREEVRTSQRRAHVAAGRAAVALAEAADYRAAIARLEGQS